MQTTAGPAEKPFLSRPEAAELLGYKTQTLAKKAVTGDGPPFLKIGRRVLYDRAELMAWARARRVESTSQSVTAGSAPRG